MLLIFLVTVKAIGKLTNAPTTTEPITKGAVAKSLTNKIIINTPISTVAAIEKMALNKGTFITIPHMDTMNYKKHMLFIHFFYKNVNTFLQKFLKNFKVFLYPFAIFRIWQKFSRFWRKLLLFGVVCARISGFNIFLVTIPANQVYYCFKQQSGKDFI